MNRAVVFDVNETMLDLAGFDRLFAGWFDDPSARKEWFDQSIHLAMTFAATRVFRGFGEIGAAALAVTADRRDVGLPADCAARLRETVLRLPPHPDVEPALRAIRDAGCGVAALSNNPLPIVQEQMRHTGLASLFDEIMSVDEAGALKPAPEVYRFAAERLALPPASIWMVSAHGWDIAGAMRAGMRGAFLARPGQAPDPFAPPDVVGNDLISVTRAILDADSQPWPQSGNSKPCHAEERGISSHRRVRSPIRRDSSQSRNDTICATLGKLGAARAAPRSSHSRLTTHDSRLDYKSNPTRMIAPSFACVTSAAYLANTPWV